MRTIIYFTSGLMALFVGLLWTQNGGKRPVETMEGARTSRDPASVSTNEQRVEIYDFERHVQASVQTGDVSKKFADLNYQGEFTLAWVNPTTAFVAFTLERGTPSTIAFEIKLKDWAIEQVLSESPKSEAEEDALNILKDFSSILAYRSSEDTNGKYQARFSEQKDERGQQVILKEKLSYLTNDGSSPRFEKSVHEISFDAETHALVSANGTESTSVRNGDSRFLWTNSTYHLNRRGIENRRMASTSTENLHESGLGLSAQTTSGPQVYSWSQILQSLDTIGSIATDERLKLFHELVKSLKSDGKNLSNFMAWTSDHGAEMGVRTFAIGALASAGTPEAQSALVKWFQQFPESRSVILNAFTTSHASFTSDTRSFLTSLLEDTSENSYHAYGAAYALGAGMKNDSSPNSEDVNRLEALVHSATTTEGMAVALGAIGNSGNEAFLPVIERSLTAEDDTVREKAVLALRLMPVADTLELVNHAWADASLKVKSAAVQVIHFQGDVASYKNILNECVQNTPELHDACLRELQ